jgi:hypothetical protein
LRPFGITGALVLEHPTGSVSRNFGIDSIGGQLAPMPTINVEILRWGLAVEFSTLYLTSRFTGGPPKEEPLNQLVPLVEFAFDSSRGTKTIATMNPGLSYVAVTWQIAVEAIVPLNSVSGHNIGGESPIAAFPRRAGSLVVWEAVVEPVTSGNPDIALPRLPGAGDRPVTRKFEGWNDHHRLLLPADGGCWFGLRSAGRLHP